MKVLIVGSGGREHALAWKINESDKVEKIFCAPGNGGMTDIAEQVNIKADDIEGLFSFAKENNIDLTVVGPEVPLAMGIVDKFISGGLRIFGPSKELAMLEGSKTFAKEVMRKFKVPTADFEVFEKEDEAKKYLERKNFPVVIKADGLAAGKGVIIAKTKKDAEETIEAILTKKVFGDAGNKIIIEDCLEGEEASILIFSDGKNVLPLVSSQDHKRIFDGDKGPNTGGMGAYSPAPVVSDEMFDEIIKKIFCPVIDGLNKEGKIFKGVLYGGLMITKDGPFVLEFNVRFGDPETQALLPRLKSDLVEIMQACIDGKLDTVKAEWDERDCICVVASSKGYPGPYEKGKEIKGLEGTGDANEVFVFHAGTVRKDNRILTSGGRVLGVSALDNVIKSARDKAYKVLDKVTFEGMYFRKDIGYKAINR